MLLSKRVQWLPFWVQKLAWREIFDAQAISLKTRGFVYQRYTNRRKSKLAGRRSLREPAAGQGGFPAPTLEPRTTLFSVTYGSSRLSSDDHGSESARWMIRQAVLASESSTPAGEWQANRAKGFGCNDQRGLDDRPLLSQGEGEANGP